MSWIKLAPITKTSGRAMASALIAVNKDGVPKVAVFLAASLVEEFGDPPRVDISAGEGDNEGSILVEFTAKGAFELKKGVGGSKRVFIPLPAGCPDKPATAEACVLGEKTAKSVVVRLPVEKWREAIATRLSRPAAVEARVSTPAVAAPVNNGRTVDMADYLRGKGLKIDRLANNRFQVDGDVLQAGAVLRLVNEKRKAADLDPLMASQVH